MKKLRDRKKINYNEDHSSDESILNNEDNSSNYTISDNENHSLDDSNHTIDETILNRNTFDKIDDVSVILDSDESDNISAISDELDNISVILDSDEQDDLNKLYDKLDNILLNELNQFKNNNYDYAKDNLNENDYENDYELFFKYKSEHQCKFLNCKLKFKSKDKLNEHIMDHLENCELDNELDDLINNKKINKKKVEKILGKNEDNRKVYYNYSINLNNLENRLKEVIYLGKGTNLRCLSHIKLAYFLFKLNIYETPSLKLNLIIDSIRNEKSIKLIKFNENKSNDQSLILETSLLKLNFKNLTNIMKSSININNLTDKNVYLLNQFSIQNLINSNNYLHILSNNFYLTPRSGYY